MEARLLANATVNMHVLVCQLSECLPTVVTGKGPFVFMESQMGLHVKEFGKLLAARLAFEGLLHAASCQVTGPATDKAGVAFLAVVL